jgi:hypothetical protein
MDNLRHEACISFAAREKQAYFAAEGWDDCDIDFEEGEEDRIARIDAMQDDFYS